MRAALDAEPWEAIVADYRMPHFDGLAALRVSQDKGLDLPFIIVSGTIGEETAVAAMKAGAHDYLMKNKLARLVPAMERELRDVAARRNRKRAEEAVIASEVRYRRLFEAARDGILILDAETGMVVDVNPFLIELLGYSREAFLGKKVWELGFLKYLFANQVNFTELLQKQYIRYEDKPLETSDGRRVDVEFVSNVYLVNDQKVIQCNIRDITERTVREKQQKLAMQVLATLNRGNDVTLLVKDILRLIKESMGLEAVGIRLHEGDDFPCYETNGFPKPFVEAERHLCARDAAGEILKDAAGDPVLECMCGNVLCGRFDSTKPFFTSRGSFWTNCTTELLASTTEKDRQSRTRNRCNGEGYESVALIPLRSGEEVVGLLQLNDHRKGMFTLDMIGFFEELGASIGVAVSRKRAADDIQALSRFPSETPAPVLRIAVDGTVLYANPSALRNLAEWHLELGQPAPAVVRDIMGRFMGSGSRQNIEIECNERFYSFSVATVTEAGYANLYALDITERKQVEEKLQFRNILQSTQQEASIDGILVVDEHACILSYNRRFVEMWRLPAKLVEGGLDEPVLRFVTAQLADPPSFLQRVQYLYEHKQETSHEEVVLADGRVFDRYSAPMFGPAERYYGRVWYFRDTTEHKRAEAEYAKLQLQLAQAQKMEAVGRLAGGVAHDFNNLLMGIMGYAELCRDKIAPDHPIREYLDEITHDAERSAEITRQLLAFARKQTIAPRVLDLNDAAAGMLKLLRRLIGEDINLTWRPGANLGRVKIDPSQVDQILANLCVNSRDAIAGAGKITIETGSSTVDADYCTTHPEAIPGAYVFLAVSDDGCGMDQETLAQVFEPFFTTKGLGKGTGLGLATVYGIVKQNNGFICAYSEPGKGTTFKIYLPEIAAESVATTVTGKAEAPRGRGETILLVEDEKSLRVTCGLFLEALDYQVLTAETPGEALKMMDQHPGDIHLLLTDVVMPGMDGRQLAQRISAVKPGVKVLLMSGYTADVIAQRGVLDEGVQFLSKPFTRDDLARKVREMLEGPRPG